MGEPEGLAYISDDRYISVVTDISVSFISVMTVTDAVKASREPFGLSRGTAAPGTASVITDVHDAHPQRRMTASVMAVPVITDRCMTASVITDVCDGRPSHLHQSESPVPAPATGPGDSFPRSRAGPGRVSFGPSCARVMIRSGSYPSRAVSAGFKLCRRFGRPRLSASRHRRL